MNLKRKSGCLIPPQQRLPLATAVKFDINGKKIGWSRMVRPLDPAELDSESSPNQEALGVL